jgi:biotin carboxyl carrier protein
VLGQELNFALSADGAAGRYRFAAVTADGRILSVEAHLEGDLLQLLVDGKMWRAVVAPAGPGGADQVVYMAGEALPVEIDRAGAQGAVSATRASGGKVAVSSPMPGRIVAVRVKPGDRVARGDLLLTLEAMKMQNEFTAPSAGRVLTVRAVAGQLAAPGELLVEIEPEPLHP